VRVPTRCCAARLFCFSAFVGAAPSRLCSSWNGGVERGTVASCGHVSPTHGAACKPAAGGKKGGLPWWTRRDEKRNKGKRALQCAGAGGTGRPRAFPLGAAAPLAKHTHAPPPEDTHTHGTKVNRRGASGTGCGKALRETTQRARAAAAGTLTRRERKRGLPFAPSKLRGGRRRATLRNARGVGWGGRGCRQAAKINRLR
jgi:hypothetical protein